MNPQPTPPRLGALISEALDAVHAHAVAVTQDRSDQAAALLESSRAQRALWERLYAVAPEEYVSNYPMGDPA